jgi:hypothetical protein
VISNNNRVNHPSHPSPLHLVLFLFLFFIFLSKKVIKKKEEKVNNESVVKGEVKGEGLW